MRKLKTKRNEAAISFVWFFTKIEELLVKAYTKWSQFYIT